MCVQAYDREMLRMKGHAATTNFPAHTYGPIAALQDGQQAGKYPAPIVLIIHMFLLHASHLWYMCPSIRSGSTQVAHAHWLKQT